MVSIQNCDLHTFLYTAGKHLGVKPRKTTSLHGVWLEIMLTVPLRTSKLLL